MGQSRYHLTNYWQWFVVDTLESNSSKKLGQKSCSWPTPIFNNSPLFCSKVFGFYLCLRHFLNGLKSSPSSHFNWQIRLWDLNLGKLQESKRAQEKVFLTLEQAIWWKIFQGFVQSKWSNIMWPYVESNDAKSATANFCSNCNKTRSNMFCKDLHSRRFLSINITVKKLTL